MSNLFQYRDIVDEDLHSRVFINDAHHIDTKVYVNSDFSGTLQQLFIIRNWETLSEIISPDELWAILKIYEYRPANIIFDGTTGNLIGDSNSRELYQKFYYNSLWLSSDQYISSTSFYFISFVLIVILIYILYTIVILNREKQVKRRRLKPISLLDLLEQTTQSQQWTTTTK